MTENDDNDMPGDDLDDVLDDSDSDPTAVRKELRRMLRTEGVRTAVTTMLDVCNDKKAMASARATCAVGLMRAAGYMSPKAADEADDAENAIDKATAAELEHFLRWSRSRAKNKRPAKKIARSEGESDDGSADGGGGAFD
jgi:hypothetical protein